MTRRIGIALAVVGLIVGLVSAGPAEATTLTIGSFDGTRSRAPFATATGTFGYGKLRASLLDPAKFGPGGVVSCDVVIAPGTPTITAAYLADKNIFVTSVFTGNLSVSEASAIAAFVAGGGCVIVDTNSDSDEQSAANSLLAAIGAAAVTGPGLACPNSSAGGAITASANVITNGPFGNVAGGTFSTSISSAITLDGRDQTLVTCDSGANVVRAFFAAGALSAGSGLVMYGGDPSGFNLFTDPAEFLFNANNEVIYLNAFAACCVAHPCPRSQGFWKTHPAAWPVTSLTLGGTTYTQAQLLAILQTPIGAAKKADASLILAHQLIAALLNIANGSDPAPISATIADAQSLLTGCSLPCGVSPSSALGQQMIADAALLDQYNNGLLTPNCTP